MRCAVAATVGQAGSLSYAGVSNPIPAVLNVRGITKGLFTRREQRLNPIMRLLGEHLAVASRERCVAER